MLNLVHFDKDRLREALHILGKLSGEHEILLCSCQDRDTASWEEGIPYHTLGSSASSRLGPEGGDKLLRSNSLYRIPSEHVHSHVALVSKKLGITASLPLGPKYSCS